MFFSSSRAVLSAILLDEYLTSAVRTNQGVSLVSSNVSSRVHKQSTFICKYRQLARLSFYYSITHTCSC